MYGVYTMFLAGNYNHQIYGHMRCIYTVLANSSHNSPTDVAIQGVRKVIVDVSKPLGHRRVLSCRVHACHEEVDKPQEGVLVHWVYVGLHAVRVKV